MRTTPRRTGMAVIAAAALSLLVTGAALAQHERAHRRGPNGGPDGNHLSRLADYLELSDEQIAQLDTLFTAHHEALEPLHREMKSNREALHAAVEDGTNPTLIGELTLEGKTLRQAMRESFASHQASIVAILDDQQRDKYEAFQAARGELGRGHGRPGRGHRGHRRRGSVEH